jgi:branched-subunit amino acid ABC-type transport system permease component
VNIFVQIFATGLTMGAMYALASVGLALAFGTMGMFNMAHGVFMTIGAYAAYTVSTVFGAPIYMGLIAGIAAGALSGALLQVLVVRFMLDTEDFQTTVMVATVGVATLLQDLILKKYGGYPFKQPLQINGSFWVGDVAIPYQSVLILLVAGLLIGCVAWLLTRSKFGLAIRATAMNPDAASLMGVNTHRAYLQVMIIAGVLAAAAGMLVSSRVGLSPDMGASPLIRAFVICVVAGLGSVPAAGVSAIVFGLLEATISYFFGARYGLPVMLGLVILVLIVKPAGLFGKQDVVRA